MRVYNFSSGPAKLPEEVLRQAGEEMLSWHGKGYSIMETSHRSPEFTAIIEETEQLLRSLLGIPADYSVFCCRAARTCSSPWSRSTCSGRRPAPTTW